MSKTTDTLQEFLDHQTKAVGEISRAAISLVPEGLRRHSMNALEESVKGFSGLLNATANQINNTSDKIKSEIVPEDKK